MALCTSWAWQVFKVDSFPLGVFVDSSETSFPIYLMLPSSGWCTCLQLSRALFTAPRVGGTFNFSLLKPVYTLLRTYVNSLFYVAHIESMGKRHMRLLPWQVRESRLKPEHLSFLWLVCPQPTRWLFEHWISGGSQTLVFAIWYSSASLSPLCAVGLGIPTTLQSQASWCGWGV